MNEESSSERSPGDTTLCAGGMVGKKESVKVGSPALVQCARELGEKKHLECQSKKL